MRVLLIVLVFCSFRLFSQELLLYKQIDTVKLFLEVYKPVQFDSTKSYPAIIFYFGGGWKSGDRSHFNSQAKYLAKRGMVCFLADYRTQSKHATTPFISLKDAKSAMRFVKSNAKKLGVDPAKIAAAGGSAGGHLAAALAFISGFNDPNDDLNISTKPSALVLFNPVIDNGPAGYGYDRISDAYLEFSPLHNLHTNAPPTLFMLGTNDSLIPVETAEYYQKAMEKMGRRCDLILYENQKHGFFNYSRNPKSYKETLLATDQFLQSLDYLSDSPKIPIE